MRVSRCVCVCVDFIFIYRVFVHGLIDVLYTEIGLRSDVQITIKRNTKTGLKTLFFNRY